MRLMSKRSLPLKIAAAALLFLLPEMAEARKTYNFNSGWNLSSSDKEVSKMLKKHPVTLPHAWNEDDSFRVSTYEMPTGEVWYRKKFRLPEEVIAEVGDGGKRVFIEFEGARQSAEVFLNGEKIGLSENGVMAFGFDLTPYIKPGRTLSR